MFLAAPTAGVQWGWADVVSWEKDVPHLAEPREGRCDCGDRDSPAGSLSVVAAGHQCTRAFPAAVLLVMCRNAAVEAQKAEGFLSFNGSTACPAQHSAARKNNVGSRARAQLCSCLS